MEIQPWLLLLLAITNGLYTVVQTSHVSRMYTIHKTTHTWNEARQLCNITGAQLLTIHNSSEWQLLEYLMSSELVSHTRPSNPYWFGLHAPDPDHPDTFYWDTCDMATYKEPLTQEPTGTTGQHECVKVWFHREVFVSIFLSMWLKWMGCNETHPYICMTPGDGAVFCILDCDEIVAPSTQSVCSSVCADQSLPCNSSYNTELAVCHVMVNLTQDKEFLNICVLSALHLNTNCTANQDIPPLVPMADNNEDVTDHVCSPQINTTITSTPAYVNIPTSSMEPTTTSLHNVTVTSMIVTDPYTTTTEPVCMCACETLHLFLAEPEPERANLTVEEKIDIIVKELTIDKKNTTSSQRKFISVMDYRASSVGLGSMSAGIIVAIFGVIVAIDLSRLFHSVANILRKLVKMLNKNRVNVIKVAECSHPEQQPDWSNSAPCNGQQDIHDLLQPRKVMTPTAPMDTRF